MRLFQKSLSEGPILEEGKWERATFYHIQEGIAKQKVCPCACPNENKA